MLAFPYTKLHTSQWNVDQAAGLILCSLEAARGLGLRDERFVYPLAVADSNHMLPLAARPALERVPGFAHAGRRAFAHAGLAAAELDRLELYSCFPVAVRVQARELGIDEARPLTVTGGMTFAGGPLNNFVLQALAKMARGAARRAGEQRPRHGGERPPHEAGRLALGLASARRRLPLLRRERRDRRASRRPFRSSRPPTGLRASPATPCSSRASARPAPRSYAICPTAGGRWPRATTPRWPSSARAKSCRAARCGSPPEPPPSLKRAPGASRRRRSAADCRRAAPAPAPRSRRPRAASARCGARSAAGASCRRPRRRA